MKRSGFLSIAALAALCFFIAACSEQKTTAEKATPAKAKVENLATTPADIKKEAKDLAEAALSYADQQKLKYLELLNEKQGQYNQQLIEIEEKIAKLNEQAKAELAAEMMALREKKDIMGLKALELQAASGEAYKDLKEGMDKSIEEMDKAYDQAMKRFQK